MFTIDNLQALISSGKVKYHHTSSCRGYWPVTRHNQVDRYTGKFGKGYIVRSASVRTTVNGHYTYNYHSVDYYIYTDNSQMSFL